MDEFRLPKASATCVCTLQSFQSSSGLGSVASFRTCPSPVCSKTVPQAPLPITPNIRSSLLCAAASCLSAKEKLVEITE